VDGNARERAFAQELVELDRTRDRLDENDDLVRQVSRLVGNTARKGFALG
jgi:hypothetical protein